MCTHLVLAHPLRHDGWILVELKVIEIISRHRQVQPSDCEAGGILTGLRRGVHLHITGLTCPGPEDRRERLAFHRAQRFHQERALARWEGSNGLVDYLGEWHTHPQHTPAPSSTDLREWRALLRHYDSPLAFLVAGSAQSLWLGAGHGKTVLGSAAINVLGGPHG